MISGEKMWRTKILLGVLLSIFILLSGKPVAAGNNMEISVLQPQLLPSFNTVGFQISFSGDDNKNSSATIKYRKLGESWQEGHPGIRVWYSDQYEWAGRIFHLEPGTQYEIEVTFSDPDGVTGENPKIFTVTSRSEPVVVNSGGQTYHVSPSGYDGNDGSLSSPFKTIEKGISMVDAGETVVVHEGKYRITSSLDVNKSGTAQAPIIIKAANGENVIIDTFDSGLEEPNIISWRDDNSSYHGVFSAPCDYEPYMVFYKGHHLFPSQSFNHLINGTAETGGRTYDIGSYGAYYFSANRIYFKFPVNFRDWSGPAEDPSSVGIQAALIEKGLNISGDHVVLDGFVVQHNKIGINIDGDYVVIRNVTCRRNWLGIDAEGYFTLIDNCEIGCSPSYWYREWKLGHDILKIHAINFNSRYGGNNVLRNSRIYGVENGLSCDSPWSNSAFGDPSYNPGVIVINNEFDLIGDDAVETDGPGYNVVIAGNYFHDCFVAISSAPIGVGPVWAIRNIIYGVDRLLPGGGVDNLGRYGGPPYSVFKFASGARPPRNGRMLIYHNTSLINANNSASPFSRIWDNAPGLDVVMRNNSISIKQGRGDVIWIQGYASGYTFNFDVDYDNLWRPSGAEFAEIIGKSYTNFSELQGDGYELNGVSEDPQYTDAAEGDFSLPEQSLLIDAGLRLPGINDEYYGTAADIGAVEYNQQPVPVELTFFKASVQDNFVLLDWNITSAITNLGFEVERSINKKDFQNIAFIRGHGTTNVPKSYQFTDETVNQGKYYYRLKQLDLDGSFEYSSIVEVFVNLPHRFSLRQNYPNPFNPSTEICYDLPCNIDVNLSVYDIMGRHIVTLVREKQTAGQKTVRWNGKDKNTINAASGIYFYRLRAGEFSVTRKMLLVR